MRVLYDHQAFTMQYWGGVSKCFCELISHFSNDIVSEIGIVESNNIHLQNTNFCPNLQPVSIDIQTFSAKHYFRGKGKLYKLGTKYLNIQTAESKNKNRSIELLKRGDFDIFHPTFFDDYYLPYLGNKPFVLTIHDMMPELFPEYFQRNDMQILAKRKLAPKAAAIIAVSEQTKNDIVKILNISPEKIHVIHHGGPPIEHLKDDKQFQFPYFLYVGQRGAYKNFKQLLVDFSIFVSNHEEVKLICTGETFTAKEKALIDRYNITKNIVQVHVDDKKLKSLYANAIAFIYPSLYEGFGMPILEAYAYGCPVLLNHKSCFPEIAGEAAVYFNSNNHSSNLSEVLETFYHITDNERNILIEKGYNRLSLFSWEKSATKLEELYQSIKKYE